MHSCRIKIGPDKEQSVHENSFADAFFYNGLDSNLLAASPNSVKFVNRYAIP